MRLSRRSFLTILGFSLLHRAGATAQTTPSSPTALRIAAASDLRFALDEVVAAFARLRPDISISVVYGASGNLFTQLSNGAPFDLFFSADVRYPQTLGEKGLVLDGSQFTYANGHIVLWVPTSSPLALEKLGMKALLDPSVRRISLANPQHAPYGRAAEAAMKALGVYDAAAPKLVFGENVSQAAQFVQSGSAEVGVIALSLALSPPLQKSGRYWPVPESAYPRLEQAAVILKRTPSPAAALAFQTFFIGPDARTILQRYGFTLPSP